MPNTYSNPDTVAPPAARYSHAVRVEMGDRALIFVCGQLPLDRDGQLIGEGDIATQAEQAFTNMAAVLAANGAAMEDVVQTTTFITDISGLADVNEVRGRHFAETAAPTSTTVEVTALARPNWLIEIEAVAVA